LPSTRVINNSIGSMIALSCSAMMTRVRNCVSSLLHTIATYSSILLTVKAWKSLEDGSFLGRKPKSA
jgi:hypothetical protein